MLRLVFSVLFAFVSALLMQSGISFGTTVEEGETVHFLDREGSIVCSGVYKDGVFVAHAIGHHEFGEVAKGPKAVAIDACKPESENTKPAKPYAVATALDNYRFPLVGGLERAVTGGPPGTAPRVLTQ